MLTAGLFSFSLIAATLGRPSEPRLVVRDAHDAIPTGFTGAGTPLSSDTIRLTIAMRQSDVPGLHAAVFDVSDPVSPNYGKHLSKAEVEQLVAPKPESVAAVTNWLQKNGISPSSSSPSGDSLTIHVPVEKANTLLSANYTSFFHEESKTSMVRTLAYALPETVNDHIDFVYPTTHFIPPSKARAAVQAFSSGSPPNLMNNTRAKRANVPQACADSVSPECVLDLYNIPTTPASAAGNTLAVLSFGADIADPNDVLAFLGEHRPDITNPGNPPFSFVSIDGVQNFMQATDEASLDLDYTVGIATNVPITEYSVGGIAEDGGITMQNFMDAISFFLAQDKPPLVISVSAGFDERTDISGFSDMAITMCNSFGQLAARGVSVLFASGDNGVAGSQPDVKCSPIAFLPTFPAGCPFVTVVGGTQGVPETTAALSSGGFSNIFPRPSYQDAALEEYLAALGPQNTNSGFFNVSGRGYPDVSAQAVNFFVLENGVETATISGTSGSCPIFASVVALLNDQLLNAGKSPLGFLNPLLYSQAAGAFNDITTGSNPGVDPGPCSSTGFPALQGWDAATGFGTPDFSKLSALLSTLGTTSQSVAPPTQSSPATQSSSATQAGSAPTGGTAIPPQQSQSASTTSSRSPTQSPSAKSNSASHIPNAFGIVAQVLKYFIG